MAVAAIAVANRHVSHQVDEICTLSYDGLVLKFYEIAQPGREVLMAVSVSSDKYPAGWGLQVTFASGRVSRIDWSFYVD